MARIVEACLEKLNNFIDQSLYGSPVDKVNEIKSSIRKMGIVTTAVAVASAVAGVLGFISSSTPVVFVALPLFYLASNISRVCKNSRDILEDPLAYKGGSEKETQNNYKNKLEEGTFGFIWIIDYVLEEMSNFRR